MIRNVVQYGHPALRQKGERVEAITFAVKALIEDLLDTLSAGKASAWQPSKLSLYSGCRRPASPANARSDAGT